ncbi:MAG: DUF2764 domain-containing protein [Tannerella sp.]|jgi:hypothetical protein|nr:DUF2764 domain-containing protein [Tannerella sp.]
MSKYYCLIAGLPSISLDDSKLAYSVEGFKAEIETILTDGDRKLVRLFFLKYDNANLLSYLRKGSVSEFDARGEFSGEDIREICNMLKSEDRTPQNIAVPAYFVAFIREYYSRFEETENFGTVLPEDKLSALYYDEAVKCENAFLASWFEMNLNIGNVMAALNCRKYGLAKEDYIVGNNEIAEQLRQSNARDVNPRSSFDYMAELMRIVEESDLLTREKQLDALRWNWLEENTFFKTFDIESVVTYILRLEMIERWSGLDRIEGEKTFRSLVTEMKRESAETLDEFKENNK